MSFRFVVRKTVQAAALLLSHEPNQTTEYLRLLKLLYIADRESLKETERPIAGDRADSMKLGPVLSQTYDLIKPECTNAEWKTHDFPEWHNPGDTSVPIPLRMILKAVGVNGEAARGIEEERQDEVLMESFLGT
jgi:uncharacterized phage-associated protein